MATTIGEPASVGKLMLGGGREAGGRIKIGKYGSREKFAGRVTQVSVDTLQGSVRNSVAAVMQARGGTEQGPRILPGSSTPWGTGKPESPGADTGRVAGVTPQHETVAMLASLQAGRAPVWRRPPDAGRSARAGRSKAAGSVRVGVAWK